MPPGKLLQTWKLFVSRFEATAKDMESFPKAGASCQLFLSLQVSTFRIMKMQKEPTFWEAWVDYVYNPKCHRDHCNAATFHSVSFSKPNPVWFGKVTPKNCVRFSKPIPIWFGKKKNWFCKTQIPNQIQIGLENFDDHYCQCPENSKPKSVWFGKLIDFCQCLEPWTNSSFIL